MLITDDGQLNIKTTGQAPKDSFAPAEEGLEAHYAELSNQGKFEGQMNFTPILAHRYL